MAAEKNFENQVKRWLQGLGIYPLGTDPHKMDIPPIGYYEKRWGGGYTGSGKPDLHIVVCGINLDVELKAETGRPSELQKIITKQINDCGSIGLILYPKEFQEFKTLVEGVIDCNSAIPDLKRLKAAHSSFNYGT